MNTEDGTENFDSEDKLHARERILQAAAHVFAEKGLSGARTREIARRAGLNNALIHYYFSSKENLYYAVIQGVSEQLFSGFQQIAKEDVEPKEKIRQFFELYFKLIAKKPHLPRIMMHEILKGGKVLQDIARNLLKPAHDQVIAYFSDAIEEGLFRRVDARQVLISVVGMTVIYFISWPVIQELWETDLLAPEALEARKESLIDLLFHGITMRPEGTG